jgi:hypothetical protein
MHFPICRHIKTNGLQCQSPSLEGAHWCYFHSRLHKRHDRFRPTQTVSDFDLRMQHVELIALEDRESVQVALSVVINALASGQMEARRATALLYGLQLASSNAANLNIKPFAREVVRSAESTPEGLDLAEPGTVIEITDHYDPTADLALDDEEDEAEKDDTPEWFKQLALMDQSTKP